MFPLFLLAVLAIDAGGIAQTSATLNALGPHPFGSPRNQAAAQFVAAKLRDAGLSQTALDDFETEGVPGSNVIATLPGRTDRILIIATHHDSKKDSDDVAGRSRSLSLLIEFGKLAAAERPAKTWVIASFDGGAARGEGLARYLETLGKSRSLVDGIVLLDATAGQENGGEKTLLAPACPRSPDSSLRSIAGHEMVTAAVGGVRESMEFAFDDPGIALVTQPFIRAFKTACDPTAARALSAGMGVLQVTDTPFSRSLIQRPSPPPAKTGAVKDPGGAVLGEFAFAVVQGLDARTFATPQSDAWLVIGRTVWSGFVVFLIGLATLIPGLVASRSSGSALGARAAYSLLFALALYSEPEVALFTGLLPTLFPPSAPKKFLIFAFIPLVLFLSAGGLGLARGQVQGTWLTVWDMLFLLGAFAILFVIPARGRKVQSKGKRSKR